MNWNTHQFDLDTVRPTHRCNESSCYYNHVLLLYLHYNFSKNACALHPVGQSGVCLVLYGRLDGGCAYNNDCTVDLVQQGNSRTVPDRCFHKPSSPAQADRAEIKLAAQNCYFTLGRVYQRDQVRPPQINRGW